MFSFVMEERVGRMEGWRGGREIMEELSQLM